MKTFGTFVLAGIVLASGVSAQEGIGETEAATLTAALARVSEACVEPDTDTCPKAVTPEFVILYEKDGITVTLGVEKSGAIGFFEPIAAPREDLKAIASTIATAACPVAGQRTLVPIGGVDGLFVHKYCQLLGNVNANLTKVQRLKYAADFNGHPIGSVILPAEVMTCGVDGLSIATDIGARQKNIICRK